MSVKDRWGRAVEKVLAGERFNRIDRFYQEALAVEREIALLTTAIEIVESEIEQVGAVLFDAGLCNFWDKYDRFILNTIESQTRRYGVAPFTAEELNARYHDDAIKEALLYAMPSNDSVSMELQAYFRAWQVYTNLLQKRGGLQRKMQSLEIDLKIIARQELW